MSMSQEDRAAKKKRDKQRQKANKKKPTTVRAPGVVGSPISGSGTAKVKAHKDFLPRDEEDKGLDYITENLRGWDAPAPRSAVFQEGAGDHEK